MSLNKNVAAFIIILAVVCFGPIAEAQKIYLTPTDALKLMFKKSSTVSEAKQVMPPELRRKLEKAFLFQKILICFMWERVGKRSMAMP